MSDLPVQTSMGDDILQMIVCFRDGKETLRTVTTVEQLPVKAMYPEEAKNVTVALDITSLKD
jgi:hypothetical protein